MSFISVDFHLHYLASYTLYIQTDFINNHLVVLNAENEVLVYFHYDNLQPSQEVMKFLSYPFTNVIVGMPQQSLVWVPQEVFDPSDKALYAPYFVDENLDNILVKDVDTLNVVALYQFDQLLMNRWRTIFPEVKFVPNFEILVHQAGEHITSEGEVLGIHVYDQQVDLFLFIGGEFKLYNTFEVATPDDLSYFVISVLKNFSLQGKVQKVLLSGVEENSDWATRLNTYTDNLILLEPKTTWSSSDLEVKKALVPLNILADTGLCE